MYKKLLNRYRGWKSFVLLCASPSNYMYLASNSVFQFISFACSVSIFTISFFLSVCKQTVFRLRTQIDTVYKSPWQSRNKKTAFSSTKFAINIIELFSMNSFSIGCSRWIIFHVKKVCEAMIKLSPRRLGIEETFCQIDSPVAGYISPRQKQGCHYLWLLPIKLKQRASSSLKSEKTPSGSTT